jgi:hypothetical protein
MFCIVFLIFYLYICVLSLERERATLLGQLIPVDRVHSESIVLLAGLADEIGDPPSLNTGTDNTVACEDSECAMRPASTLGMAWSSYVALGACITLQNQYFR